MNSVKLVKFAAALVSMLSLETAMLTAFGAEMDIFEKVLEKFFDGEKDEKMLELLGKKEN